MDSELATEVPDSLKRLTRLIVRGFYSMEATIVIDMLVRNPCIKEDDIMELLRFERKQLRSVLNSLKVDKILKARMRVETDADGKTTRHNYYFINYNVFVNVVKYKLDHIRRKIELEERDNTSRASFKCPDCMKSFTDLEVGQLVDPTTGSLMCTFCQTEVEEDESSMPKKDARTSMAKFNEQIQVIYDLLRDCEDIKLAPEILEPEPVDISKLLAPRTTSDRNRHGLDADKMVWSGELSRNNRFGYQDNSITISMDSDNRKEVVQKKEVPKWMSQSTVDGASMLEDLGEPSFDAGTLQDVSQVSANDEVMNALLVHEQQSKSGGIGLADRTDDNSSSSSDDEASKPGQAFGTVEEMESDDEEESVPMVAIGNHKVSYHDVTPSMVEKMTAMEKEEYIRVGQELYQDMYE